MKEYNKKFIILIVSFVFIMFLWLPVNHLLLMFNIKELEKTDNWTNYVKTKTSLVGKIEDNIKSIETNLQNRVNTYFPFNKIVMIKYYDTIIKINSIFSKDIPISKNSSDEYIYYNKENELYYVKNNKGDKELENRLNSQVSFFNNINDNIDANLNIYIVPRLEQTKLIDNNIESYTNTFKVKLNKNINVKEFNINSIEDYKKYFYKTDHHWNMYGAYQGYIDISNMLNREYLDLDVKKVSNKKIYGSFAKSSLSKLNYDYLLDVDYKDNLDVIVNDKNNKFKPRNITYNGNYDFYDYYINYFNGQYSNVLYKNKSDSMDNLLIISDSYAWQIDYLIASSYNNTYVVNIRYDEYINNKLKLKEFVRENNIKDILFLYEGVSTLFDIYDYGFNSKIEV